MKYKTQDEKELLSVLVIDDHKMVRDGLKLMLASLNKFLHCKIYDAESGEEALKKIGHLGFDLVIVDYKMPGISGAETIYRILRYKPHTKILVLSNYDELPYIQTVMDAGAKGYVLKNIEPAEMLKAIKTILSGRIYYCSEVALKIIESSNETEDKKILGAHFLTVRETEVLQLIAMEFTNEEIAKRLFVARRTIDTHRQNLLQKLRVKNTAGLVKAAFKMNLLKST